jgi:UDP-N-acetyl-D-mannosaminuronate dehydrogenase
MISLEAISTRQSRVAIIGPGYVGLPLVRAFVGAGLRTLGFEGVAYK